MTAYTEPIRIEHEYVVATCNFPLLGGKQANILVQNNFDSTAYERAGKRRAAFLQSRLILPEAVYVQDEEIRNAAPNVVVLLFRSLSRRHFQRMLPETNSFLKQYAEMGQAERKSSPIGTFSFPFYHILSDSSALGNQLAMLYGSTEFGASSRKFSPHASKGEWLWDTFHRRGYVSMYGEESCDLNDSVRKYFSKGTLIDHKFTELYCRLPGLNPSVPYTPTSFAAGNNSLQLDWWQHGVSCVGNRHIHSILLEYVQSFLENYDGVGRLAVASFEQAREKSMLRIKSMDADLLNFLRFIYSHPTLQSNTVVVLASDQGYNENAYFVQSLNGLHEFKYPLFKCIFPRPLLSAYPTAALSLQANQKRLLTGHDLYGTIQHLALLHLDEKHSKQHEAKELPPQGSQMYFSALTDIPLRKCSEAGVDPKLCLCYHNWTLFLLLSIIPTTVQLCLCYHWFCSSQNRKLTHSTRRSHRSLS